MENAASVIGQTARIIKHDSAIRTTLCFAEAIACLSLALASPASADPTGTVYGVVLDAVVVDIASGAVDAEGHFGVILFDGLPGIIPNDIVPLPSPPFAPSEAVNFYHTCSSLNNFWR